MPADRLLRILALLREPVRSHRSVIGLCEVAAKAIDVTSASVMLMSGDLPRGSGCTSSAMGQDVAELQFTLGEGPCIDAFREDRPVLEPSLADSGVMRWVAFAAPAVEAGVLAVFAFPLRVGAVRLGALNLCNDRPGPLTFDQHADALVMADVAARALLATQAEAPPGALAAELENGSDFRYVVHQASGMVSVQLEVSVAEALIRLRAYAFGNDQMITTVAEDVVARRLRFD